MKAETLMEVVALLNRVEIIILIVNVTDRDNIVITFMWDMSFLLDESLMFMCECSLRW